MFKRSCDQLEALLPESSFSLETSSFDVAVATTCQSMQQKGDRDNSKTFTGALMRAWPVVQTTPRLVVLQNIRRWALELLLDEQAGEELMRCGPIPYPTFPNGDNNMSVETRELTARQVRGILANAFFRNIRDVMADEKDERNRGGLDWHRLFTVRGCALERLKCHLLYFEAMSKSEDTDLDRCIVFERIRYKPIDFLSDRGGDLTEDAESFVGKGVILHDKPMETPTRQCSAFVNFANPNYGYGKFIPSATQEEILESCCPEITAGMLLIGKLNDDEVVNVRNVRRFAMYSGYLESFQCQGPAKKEDIFKIQIQ